MGFKVPVCVKQEDVDIEKLIEDWNTDPVIVNHLVKHLTEGEYAIINFIVNEGLYDILGQKSDIEEPDDDPFAKPNPDYNVQNPDFIGDDPFAAANVWDAKHPGIYDPITNTIKNTLGKVLWSATMDENESPTKDYPYTQDWIEYYTDLNPGKRIPYPPINKEDEGYNDFAAYLIAKYGMGNVTIIGGEPATGAL